ncbi:MAG: pentapeptide repeat-containing protein [Planctomycetales bacterium]|nr:pentapeptide repeat-containing protein [Planctomycetales bacterium]
MNRADALRLLQDGLSGITRWNAERASGQPIADLSGIQLSGVKLCHRDPTTRQRVAADLSDVRLVDARFDGADLSRVNLENADLSGASLTGARLTRARLVRATLARADLSNATLRGAGLRLADLWRTRCVEAVLRDAVLAKSTLASTDLTGADLRGATLYEALAVRTNFLGAKLDRAYLRRCRFVGANLTNATIEGARVDGMTLDDLAGLPNAPSELRSGDRRISGDEARHFFHKEFSVELFLTERLTERELGAYHFHLDELHSRDSALGVAFVGCRFEADGTVLRFQSRDRDAIYRAVPDLLAPFRRNPMANWREAASKLAPRQRSEALAALARAEATESAGGWEFARRMAAAFEGFYKARVIAVQVDGGEAVRLDLYPNDQAAAMLTAATQVDIPFQAGPVSIVAGDHADIVYGGNQMNRSYEKTDQSTHVAGSVTNSAVGAGASFVARDVAAYRDHIQATDQISADLKQMLLDVRLAIESLDVSAAVKDDVRQDYEKLTDELGKDNPEPTRLERLWAGIQRVAEGLEPVAKLGVIIQSIVQASR